MSIPTKPTTKPLAEAPRHGTRRAVLASGCGNLLESYDVLVYGYLAVVISHLFFPTGDDATALLATFATFAIGFLARPIGTLIFGHIGDKYGRKLALVISVMGMAVLTVSIGFLPTYEQVGWIAPALLVLLRFFQGLAFAGEWAGAASLLVEFAPKGKRGLFGSFQQFSVVAGFLLASGVVLGLNDLLTPEQMEAFGWRIPFFIGALTGLAALLLRFGMDDTPAFLKEVKQGTAVESPIRTALTTQMPAILKGFGFTIIWAVGYFFFLTYIPTYLTAVAEVDPGLARSSNFVGLVVLLLFIVPFGSLSDRTGRKPILVAATLAIAVLSFPVLIMLNSGSVAMVYAGQVLIALALSAFAGPGVSAIAEFFPTNVRYSAMGIGYNFSVMAFGGTAPLIATAMVQGTGDPLSAAWIPLVAALVSLGVVVSMRDRSGEELR